MVSLPPYKEWAGFKWLLQECSARPLCSVLLQLSSQKTSPIARSCTVQLSHGRLLWNFRNSINDGRRSKAESGTCGSMDLGANMQRHQSQRGRHFSKDSSKLHSFDFVSSQSCLSGEKERYGGKKCCRTLQPPPLLFFRHFQAIEQLSINWGAQPPPALLDPSKSI